MISDRKNWIGGLLVLFGVLLLLEQFNILKGVPEMIWGALLILLGSAILSDHLRLPGPTAWKVFPGLALIAWGIESVLPSTLKMLDGSIFLTAMGVAFLFFMRGQKGSWWAVIPAGVFFSLAITSLVGNLSHTSEDGIFLIGLGITFILLAEVQIQGERRQWGYIPGGVLVLLGGLQFANNLDVSWDYLLPAILITAGLLILVRSFTGTKK